MADAFIHEKALVESTNIGKGTKVWAFVHILPNAKIGSDCNICDHCFIENDVVIGNNVTIKSGIYIWDGARIGDNVFLGPAVVFTNDVYPRSKRYPEKFLETVIEENASIGANSTLLAGVTIGRNSMIGIGSVVTRNIPPYAIAYGNPAMVQGWIDKEGIKMTTAGQDKWADSRGMIYLEKDGQLLPVE